MAALRSFLRAFPRLIPLLLALALATRLLVPAGYMLAVEHGRLVIVTCPASMPSPMPHAASEHGGAHHEGPDGHAKPELPCAFASLTAPLLGPVDPVMLVLALASVALLALLRPAARPVLAALRWRPPLRGPPTLILTC